MTKLYEYLLIKIIKQGKIPNHATFVMDGNRRYTEKMSIHLKSTYELGSENQLKMIDLFYELGVNELSVWMISVDNFKRDFIKIEPVLKAIDKLCDFIIKAYLENIKNDCYYYQCRFIGDISYMKKEFPENLMQKIKFIQDNENLMDRHKKLYIYLAYFNRNDITTKIEMIKQNLEMNKLNYQQIDKFIFDRVSKSPMSTLDLLIRTSRMERLSDFLGWYINQTSILFEKCLWPEYSFTRWIKSLILYQVLK